MPVNVTVEYLKAEEKFRNARAREEKITALEEMIRTCPSHKGAENLRAQLRAKLARLKKEGKHGKAHKRAGIRKDGYGQVCLIGLTNAGKSTLLSELTDAKPKISNHSYTTTKPVVGMMDYKGIKIQIIEIPSTFEHTYLSIVRTADCMVFVVKSISEKKDLEKIAKDNFLRTKRIIVNPWCDKIDKIKEKIWNALGLMIVYTKDGNRISPMALPKGSDVKRFAASIHKDFVNNFRFARLWRLVRGRERIMQVGLKYMLKENDKIEIHIRR